MGKTAEPSGLLVVDKPIGPTSHDVVAAARRLYRTRAVGHAGTLDPLASGVLLLLFGEGTKLVPHLTLDTKRYRAEVAFGHGTDTLDAQGQVTASAPLASGWLTAAALAAALGGERARTTQVPPAFSAIKVEGERAHRRSRRGETVVLPPRPVAVHELTLLAATDASVTVELAVSKGYYVRAFARDLAAALGVPGHLVALRRLASGSFRADEAQPWPPTAPPPLIPIHTAAARALPLGTLNATGVARARHGQPLTPDDFAALPPATGVAAWLSETGALVALGEPRGAGFGVVRGFAVDA